MISRGDVSIILMVDDEPAYREVVAECELIDEVAEKGSNF